MPVSAPVALSGTITTIDGGAFVPNGYLLFIIQNATNYPLLNGQPIPRQFLRRSDSTGALSGTIPATSDIASPGASGTSAYYEIWAYSMLGDVLWTRSYQASGATFDLNAAIPLGPIVVSPTPPVDTLNGTVLNVITVPFSTTPVFTTSKINRLVLAGSVIASTLPAGTDGELVGFLVIQNATGSWTFAWPTNMAGGMGIDLAPNSKNVQFFFYSVPDSLWIFQTIGASL